MNEKQKQEIWAKADRYVESIEEDTGVYLKSHVTFDEFADAYAAAVPNILAKMKYLERIGRDPFNENKPLPKWWNKMNNLKERRKQNRSNKIPF